MQQYDLSKYVKNTMSKGLSVSLVIQNLNISTSLFYLPQSDRYRYKNPVSSR